MSYSILTVGPSGGASRYKSIRATSRALSGNGSDSIRSTIGRRIDEGGGYIGNVWVQQTALPGITRT
jgi:hypothetical protein